MAVNKNNMPALETESATPKPETGSFEVSNHIDNALSVQVDSLPKLVMCFDINTLSHQNLKAIASDLKVPDYSQMTKEQLCEALLAL